VKRTLRIVAIILNCLLLVSIVTGIGERIEPSNTAADVLFLVLLFAAPVSALVFLLKYGK
jgi:hypothetical protein